MYDVILRIHFGDSSVLIIGTPCEWYGKCEDSRVRTNDSRDTGSDTLDD